MSSLTPLNSFPTPDEYQEPYFPTIKGYFLAVDMSVWDLAENDNLVWSGGGVFSWSASAGLLVWSLPVAIYSKTTPYSVTIPGPPTPGGQVSLSDGQCAFFQLPRLLVANQTIPAPLNVGPLALLPGVRLENIKILATCIGTTVYFPNGASLNDGQSGVVFGGGIGTTITPHEHQPALVIQPISSGVSSLDLNIASFAPAVLKLLQLYRNGVLQYSPGDYTVNLGTGIVTLVVPTISPSILDPNPETFVALMETSPPIITNGQHDHLPALVTQPIAGTTLFDMLVTSLDYPSLGQVNFFRNGAIQYQPGDYNLNLTTGLITITDPSVAGETFVSLREVEY
jgi:hypothetical protein